MSRDAERSRRRRRTPDAGRAASRPADRRWPVEPPASAIRADRSVVTAARGTDRSGRRVAAPPTAEPATAKPAARPAKPTAKSAKPAAKSAKPAASTRSTKSAARSSAKPSPRSTSRSLPPGTSRPVPRTSAPAPSGAGLGVALLAALLATLRGVARLCGRIAHHVVDAFLEVTHPSRSETATSRRAASRIPVADSRRRLVAVLVFLGILFMIVTGRLAGLQLFGSEDYAAYGLSQRMRVETLAADRGTITDRNGVELALSAPQRSVFVDPALVEDPAAEAAQVAQVLGLDGAEVEAKMRADNRFGYIARHVPDDLADRVEALDLPGVAFVTEPKRVAPSGGLASSIVGTVDVDGTGISGIEQQYGELLTGDPGKLVFEQTPAGRTIPVGEHDVLPAQRGHDVRLTLDRGLQFEVERILTDSVRANDARAGTVIVAKPDTGEILAMANIVNDRETGEIGPSSNNEALTTVYEPGSVMKVVAASGAMEDGHVTPDSRLTVPDAIQFGPDTIKEHDYHGTVSWSVSEIIQRSSNTGTIRLAQMLGKERLHEYLTAFGFNHTTGLGFPNEAAGFLPDPEDWWDSSIGTIPIGQGISVTPLQMLGAYNAIANGGTLMAPRLVGSTVGPDGTVTPAPIEEGRQVVSQATADNMNLMLRNVVSAEGTAKDAYVPGYTVAGKTGTARKPQPNGTYTDENGVTQYTATFVGFAPAEAPAVSVIVIIDEPRAGAYYGGLVAAPTFSKITQYALQVLGVEPPATDGPAGGVPATPEVQAEAATRGAGTTSVQVTPDGRVRAPAATSAEDAAAAAAAAGNAGGTGGGTTVPSTGVPGSTVPVGTTPTTVAPSTATTKPGR